MIPLSILLRRLGIKLEKVFAKPFLGSLDGHTDGISALAKHPKRLSTLAAAATTEKYGFGGFARGLTFSGSGDTLISVGDDKIIHTWKTPTEGCIENLRKPLHSVATKSLLNGISHHRNEDKFATCGESTALWTTVEMFPKRVPMGVDSIHCVRFNMVEESILAACASDRSIILYDVRESNPMRKVCLDMKSNALAWNPMEAMIFTVANE
ncbi:WD repeat and SOF domain-containing protein 1, partial [Caligus rogercresseyi]